MVRIQCQLPFLIYFIHNKYFIVNFALLKKERPVYFTQIFSPGKKETII